MADMMTFSDTVEEFMEQYKIVDAEKVYTNGAEMIPIFRMQQWFEHVSATDNNVGTTDTISRQAAIDVAKGPVVMQGIRSGKSVTAAAVDAVKCMIVDGLRELPPAQPRIPDKIIKELTQMNNALDCQTPCNDLFPDDWCQANCQWKEPQEQCWRRWAEKEMSV